MKLYREAPPEKGTGLSLHEFKGDWAEPTYKCSLEPIEITEIEKAISDFDSNYENHVIPPRYHRKLAKAILSKLKGDE